MAESRRITTKRIGVIMGGTSSEREVSLNSGRPMVEALRGRGYDAVGLDVTNETIYHQVINSGIGVAFLALHGGTGENGAVQGMLEVLGIPYTGSGVMASAIAMDKVMSKFIFRAAGLNVPEYIVLEGPQMMVGVARLVSSVPPPWVVKPAAEGSSIGVCRVDTADGLDAAVREAARYGGRVIVERFVAGREVHIGILGERALGGVEVRPKGGFYDYRSKYTSGMTEYILPPEIEPAVYETVKRQAEVAHGALGCRVYSRVDFLVDGKGRPWVLEVNTLPGMTPTSLLPKIARQAGYEFEGLLEEILGESLKHQEKG